jgi:transcriptional regulator with XRE-family HTH domain
MVTRPPQARLIRAGRQTGEHLATWRKLLGLTMTQVAERAAISRPTLAKIEAGDLGVSFGSYLNVMRALGQLDAVVTALDPYESDLGRARSESQLPQRVRRPSS